LLPRKLRYAFIKSLLSDRRDCHILLRPLVRPLSRGRPFSWHSTRLRRCGEDFHVATGGRAPICRQAARRCLFLDVSSLNLAALSWGCAWHGHWIGGESPLRGELVATASQRQLHAASAVVRRQSWRREAVWGRSPRRTAAPNASEALSRPGRPGERAPKRDAQNPTEVGAVVGTAAAGHPVFLPREVCMGPRER
jgi:hypothetical protein